MELFAFFLKFAMKIWLFLLTFALLNPDLNVLPKSWGAITPEVVIYNVVLYILTVGDNKK